MTLLLNHSYQLLIGSNNTSYQTIELTEHDVHFEIVKDTATGSKAKFKIFNLDPSDYDLIESYGENVSVIFLAGYLTDTTSEIFTGNSNLIFNTTENEDHIINIHADSSETLMLDAYSQITIPSEGSNKATRRKAIKALANDLQKIARLNNDYINLSVQDSNLQGLFMDDTFESGFSWMGTTAAGLDWLCNSVGYDWFIDQGEFYVKPKSFSKATTSGSFSGSVIYQLSADSGLYSIEKKVGKAAEGLKLTARCALLNKVSVGDKVEVIDELANGTFKIDKIKTSGQFIGDLWDTELELSTEASEKAKSL